MNRTFDRPIFVYDDYPEYLRDWLAFAKRYGFTQKKFLESAGISSQAYLSDVVARRKRLGEQNSVAITAILGLKDDAAEYFRLLVKRGQQKPGVELEKTCREITELRRKNLSAIVERGSPEYFSSWHYSLVRELLLGSGGWMNPKEISESLCNLRISLPEIRRALKKLSQWKLVEEGESDCFRSIESAIVSYSEMPHSVVNDVKHDLITASINAMSLSPKNERHISMAIRGISPSRYDEFCKRIDELRQEFLSGEDNDPVSRVCVLNVQIFPVARLGRSESKEESGNEI